MRSPDILLYVFLGENKDAEANISNAYHRFDQVTAIHSLPCFNHSSSLSLPRLAELAVTPMYVYTVYICL